MLCPVGEKILEKLIGIYCIVATKQIWLLLSEEQNKTKSHVLMLIVTKVIMEIIPTNDTKSGY